MTTGRNGVCIRTVACHADATPLVAKAVELLTRTVRERTGVRLAQREGRADLVLDIRRGVGKEGFEISRSGRSVTVVGNDEPGLLYGVGKLLRGSSYARSRFGATPWRGRSIPEKPIRGMYFATHFHNYYHIAPIEDVRRYVEELALWGCNYLSVWFDMHHYHGIADPRAHAMIARLLAIIQAGRDVGMKIMLTTLANEGYADTPAELRIVAGPATYGVEVCPCKPGGLELILQTRREMLDAFAPARADGVWLWPYDQGGCYCDACKPWGPNGYLRTSEAIAALVRQMLPDAAVVASTWWFDFPKSRGFDGVTGEYAELTRVFKAHPPTWADYLMIDAHAMFPEYPLEFGVPGNLPVLGFPELSMYNMSPWGGFGANPSPVRWQRYVDQCVFIQQGGFPYSEGIFEDINKVFMLQSGYWDTTRSTADVLDEYLAYEFGPDHMTDLAKAISLMEARDELPGTPVNSVDKDAAKAEAAANFPGQQACYRYSVSFADRCWELIRRVDRALPARGRRSWRWRILYLRALLGAELARTRGRPSEASDAAFEELDRLYGSGRSAGGRYSVLPPSRAMLATHFGKRE